MVNEDTFKTEKRNPSQKLKKQLKENVKHITSFM
jgi:hypothetical protein